MDYILQRALVIAVGVVVALIIISVVLFVYDQVVTIYTSVDKVDVSLINIDDEYAKFDNNEMRGVEILNTIKKYKRDKDHFVITFNLVKNGSIVQLDKTNNWDTYIGYFNGSNTRYVDALSNTYTVTMSTLADNRIKIVFTCK